MPLLSNANLQAATDKLARLYESIATFIGPNPNLTVNTGQILQVVANNLLGISVASDDYDVEGDLNSAFYSVAEGISASQLAVSEWAGALAALNTHYANHSAAGGLAEYLLTTNNPTGSLPIYVVTVDPWFQDFWTAFNGTGLDIESCVQKPIHPSWTGTSYTNASAMGAYTVTGATYTPGYACNANYGAVVPTIEVTSNFTGGTTALNMTVSGLDQNGNAATWSITGGPTNPTATVSTTTTSPVTAASERTTITLASGTGIAVGSVLTINAGLVDQEVVLVEAMPGGNEITCVFLENHASGATVTGLTTLTPLASPTTSRLRQVTGITIANSYTAGAVRVTGLPARIAI